MTVDVYHLVLAVPELGLGDGVTGGAVALCGDLGPAFFWTSFETFMAMRVASPDHVVCFGCAEAACAVADLVGGIKEEIVSIDSTLKADEAREGALASDPRKGDRRASPLPCGRTGPAAGWTCSREFMHEGPCAASKILGPVLGPLDPKPESPTARAIRDELLRVFQEPLTVRSLRKAGRIVSSAIKVLRAVDPGVDGFMDEAPRRRGLGQYFPGPFGQQQDPDAVDLDDGGPVADGPDVPAYAPPVETFGTNTFREVAASVVKLLEKKGAAEREPGLDELVDSLARAKEANLSPSVVRRLEQAVEARLGAGHARDVEPTSVVVSDHDSRPEVSAATIRECSTRDVGPA